MNSRRLSLVLAVIMSVGTISAQNACRMPDFIKEGDKVAVVAPAYWLDEKKLDEACSILAGWGLQPVLGKSVCKYIGLDKYRYYIGPVHDRISDLEWALKSDDIKAIICARGGYGAIQLIDDLDVGMFRDNPKWLVGYSDITTLHMVEAKAGVMSIHGNMCGDLSKNGAENESNCALKDLLFGKLPEYELPHNFYDIPGNAEGRMLGGNMITLAALFETDFDVTRMGPVILFLEEVGESMHAIDRLFQILMRKDTSNIKGIVLGEFTEYRKELVYDSIEELLHGYVRKMGIPMCCGFPAGHGKVNMPFIEGSRISMNVGFHGSRICFLDVSHNVNDVLPPVRASIPGELSRDGETLVLSHSK